jgi:CysZ protein
MVVALTPFAAHWSQGARELLRASLEVSVFLALVAIAILSFAAIANLVGQPFYEAISERVERQLGGTPGLAGAAWWRRTPRAVVESVVVLVLLLVTGVPLFVLGFVPVLGQTIVPLLGAVVSGYFLALELLAVPLERRGMRLRERLRFVWRHRAVTAGFGIATFLLFLVPLANVVAMPGAVVGGTLLVHRLMGQVDQRHPPPSA